MVVSKIPIILPNIEQDESLSKKFLIEIFDLPIVQPATVDGNDYEINIDDALAVIMDYFELETGSEEFRTRWKIEDEFDEMNRTAIV